MVPSWRNVPVIPVAFGVLAILWGSSFVAIEIGLPHVSPLLFAALRYDIAGVVLLAFAVATTDEWMPRDADSVLAVLGGGALLIGAHHAFLYLGQQYVSGAVAAVVVSLVPVLTVLFASSVFPDERLTAIQYSGVALGFVGVVIVISPTPGHVADVSLFGVGLLLVAAASMALGTVGMRPLDPAIPIRSMQAWAMLVGAVLLHGASLLSGESTTITWTPSLVGALLYLALGSSVVAYLLYFYLLTQVGPSELNLVIYAQPVPTTAISWVVLGSLIDPTTIGGLVTIFGGFALVKHDRVRRLVNFDLSPVR